MKKGFFFFLCVTLSVVAWAQPGTEIYLFDLKTKGETVIISNPKNITNKKGYDNQPFFHPDKPLLYFVSANDQGRTDIITYNYKSGQTKKLTDTHDREYSPTVTPDKKFISCILQRDSGAQDLVKYPIDGGEPEVILNNLIVGYHAWANVDQVVVFTLPQPFKLHLLDFKAKTDTVLAEQIGRSLHRIPKQQAVSFVQKVSDTEWNVNRVDAETKTVSLIAKSLPGAEHAMAWSPDGMMIMSEDKKLFYFKPGESSTWTEIEIRSDTPIPPISRIAVSHDGKTIALVMSEL